MNDNLEQVVIVAVPINQAPQVSEYCFVLLFVFVLSSGWLLALVALPKLTCACRVRA